MDAIDKLVSECEVSAAVLGRGESFMLIDTRNVCPEAVASAHAQHFNFCGVVGVKGGHLELELSSLDPETVKMMAFAAVKFAECQTAQPVSDGVDWLERLHRLPDTRGPALGGARPHRPQD